MTADKDSAIGLGRDDFENIRNHIAYITDTHLQCQQIKCLFAYNIPAFTIASISSVVISPCHSESF